MLLLPLQAASTPTPPSLLLTSDEESLDTLAFQAGAAIQHEATHLLHVRSLPTGFSHDIHGEIVACTFASEASGGAAAGSSGSQQGGVSVHNWRFKAQADTVRIFT